MRYLQGLALLNLHKDSQAKAAFLEAARLDPGVYQARWGTAEVLRRQHDLKASESLLQAIIKDHPDFAPAYISLAYIRYIQGQYNDAVTLAQTVIAMGRRNVDLSNYTRAYLILAGSKGMIAHYGGPFSKVVNGTAVFSTLKKAQKLQPDSPGVLFGLGAYYLLAPKLAGGDLVKAEGYLQGVLKADPLFTDAYVRLAQLYRAQGDLKLYNQYLEKALQIDPGNELALDAKSGNCKYICPGKN
jgi:tetratricopeptide (TPR) repeat protein